MIDGSMVIGLCAESGDNEDTISITNAVLLGSIETDYIEQKYYFKGMHCPFSVDSPIVTKIQKNSIMSVYKDLDSQLELQYNKFVASWFGTRDKLNTLEEEAVKSELEQKIEVLARALANTVIH